MTKKSIRYGHNPEEVSRVDISYTEKADFIKKTYGMDSRLAAITYSIDLMYMQAKGEILRFTKEDIAVFSKRPIPPSVMPIAGGLEAIIFAMIFILLNPL